MWMEKTKSYFYTFSLYLLSVPGRTTEPQSFSIFDTPGSDSFNFGSHRDSLHDSQASLEWDPQGDRTLCGSLIIVLYYWFSLYINTDSYITQSTTQSVEKIQISNIIS